MKKTEPVNELNELQLIAPCGMNCAICAAFLRKRNRCPGCRCSDEHRPVTRYRCRIKNCERIIAGGADSCSHCDERPCKALLQLDRRYRTKYGMSMLENLDRIRKSGIDAFVQGEIERWRCHSCGGTICVHKWNCSRCGEKRQRDTGASITGEEYS